jgi:hypothetical protein
MKKVECENEKFWLRILIFAQTCPWFQEKGKRVNWIYSCYYIGWVVHMGIFFELQVPKLPNFLTRISQTDFFLTS